MDEQLFTVKEVAKILDKTPQGIHWLINEGRIKPASMAGKYKFFTQASIDDYLKKYGKAGK